MPMFDPEYAWLDDREPLPPWRRINWWRVVPLVLSFAVVAGTMTMCSLTLF